MPTRPYPYVLYRCTHCWREVHAVTNQGLERRLWCPRCACTQAFRRMDMQLKAPTWPPAEREVEA